MQTLRYHLIGVLFIAMFAASCTPRYYAPNQHNVPLFQEKGDMHLSLVKSGGDDVSGSEVQGAYALTDRIGVIGNVFAASGSKKGSHGLFMEGGAGYFRGLLKHIAFETYGGAGIGRAVNPYGSGSSTLWFSKYFVQPDIGFKSRFIDAAVSLRMARLHYSSVRPFSTVPASFDDVEYIRQHPTSMLVEPAYILRVGWDYAKAQIQISRSHNVTAPQLQQEKLMVGLGFYYSGRNR